MTSFAFAGLFPYIAYPMIASMGLSFIGGGYVIAALAVSTYLIVDIILKNTFLKDPAKVPVGNSVQNDKSNGTDLLNKLGKILEPVPKAPVFAPIVPNPTLLRLHNLFRRLRTFLLPSWNFEACYSSKLSKIGQTKVFEDILSYFETEYKKAPATLNGVALPLAYDKNLNKNNRGYKQAYYQNLFHSAHRCISPHHNKGIFSFSRNPWGGISNIASYLDKIAIIWIAITDENAVIPNGSSREDLKVQFATTCANIMRAHNINHTYKDSNYADSPDCHNGTLAQLNQLIKHLNLLKPPLNIASVMEMFEKSVILSNTESDGVFDIINTLEKEHLIQLVKAINKFAMDDDEDPLTAEDNHVLASIGLTASKIQIAHDPIAPAMQRFLKQCWQQFGWSEFSGPLPQPLQFDKKTHVSYEAFAYHLRNRALGFYTLVILEKVKERLKEITALRP